MLTNLWGKNNFKKIKNTKKIITVRTQFVSTQNDTWFARKKNGPNNIICRAWV